MFLRGAKDWEIKDLDRDSEPSYLHLRNYTVSVPDFTDLNVKYGQPCIDQKPGI